MKNHVIETRRLLKMDPDTKEFPFPAVLFEKAFTTPRYKDTLINVKLSLPRTVGIIEMEKMLKPEIESKIGVLVHLNMASNIQSLNQARLAVNRFKIMDKLKRKKLRKQKDSLVEKFSLKKMMKMLNKGKKLPDAEEMWQVSLNSKHLKTIENVGSRTASFSHKSGNRSLSNYTGYFSMSSRQLRLFYHRLYDLFIKESIKFIKEKRASS